MGIWPLEQLIAYKKIMLLHNILTSKEERFIKEIIEAQITNTWKGCWMEETAEICKKYETSPEIIRTLSKEQLKAKMKDQINKELEILIKEEATKKTKLRFCSGFERKLYTLTGNLKFNNIKSIMKLRLNMLELKTNYKGSTKNETCDLCKNERDTTEHLFSCTEIKKRVKNIPQIDSLYENKDDVYVELSEFLEKICELKNINMTKTVQENLKIINEIPDRYTIKSVSNEGLKMVLQLSES